MPRKARHLMRDNTPDYQMGYADGMKAAFEESELDAYYAGVGYGKKAAGDKHIGFNNDEERQQFEAGIQNRGKHFRSYRAEPTFFERLFGIKPRSDRVKTVSKRGAKKERNKIYKNERKSYKATRKAERYLRKKRK